MIFQQELLKKMQIFLQIFFVNATFKSSVFQNSLKLADVTPLHKKSRKGLKDNYRPVSILPTLSKIFERIMFAEISAFFDNFFSKYQGGFRKDYSTQHCLLTMLENGRNVSTKGKFSVRY